MIITKAQTEPLTLDLLNALLANFSTGLITCEELWAQIDQSESTGDESIFTAVEFDPRSGLPDSLRNRMSGPNSEAGI